MHLVEPPIPVPLPANSADAINGHERMYFQKLNSLIFATSIVALCLASSSALSQFKPHSFEISAFNNTNVGLARTDHMNDYGVQARLSTQAYYERSQGSGIFYSSEIAFSRYDVYTKLNRSEISGQIGYVKKFGIGFDKPRVSASLGLQYRDSQSAIRSGWSLTPRLQFSKNISDRTSISARLQYYQFEADSRIAIPMGAAGWLASNENPTSIQNTQIHFGGEWAWTADTYLAFDTTFIQGDFSSMALPTSGLSSYASAVSQDDVCGSAYYNYRYSGTGTVAAVAATHVFSDTYDATFRFQRTLVDADYGKGYGQNLTNLTFSKRF